MVVRRRLKALFKEQFEEHIPDFTKASNFSAA